MKPRSAFATLSIAAAALAAGMAGCASAPRGPEALATVADSFAAPYDTVWDATVRGLGVVRLVSADKTVGRIETEVFPYTYFMTDIPAQPQGPVLLASLEPGGILLAQGAGGGDNKGTQVVWISMLITVSRVADNRTQVQVEPRLHHSLLAGFTPGPTNSPWADLFAKIRSQLGIR